MINSRVYRDHRTDSDNPELPKRTWQVDKRVNLSNLFTMFATIITMGVFISQQSTRLALVEEKLLQQAAVDQRQDANRSEIKLEMMRALDSLAAQQKEMRDDIKSLLQQKR
jgi:hypothetical protein